MTEILNMKFDLSELSNRNINYTMLLSYILAKNNFIIGTFSILTKNKLLLNPLIQEKKLIGIKCIIVKLNESNLYIR